jgi:hypothetical protein
VEGGEAGGWVPRHAQGWVPRRAQAWAVRWWARGLQTRVMFVADATRPTPSTLPTPPMLGLQLNSPMEAAGLGVTSSTRAPRRAAAAAASQPAARGRWGQACRTLAAAAAQWALAGGPGGQWHAACSGARAPAAAAPACPPPTTTTSASRAAAWEENGRPGASLASARRPGARRARQGAIRLPARLPAAPAGLENGREAHSVRFWTNRNAAAGTRGAGFEQRRAVAAPDAVPPPTMSARPPAPPHPRQAPTARARRRRLRCDFAGPRAPPLAPPLAPATPPWRQWCSVPAGALAAACRAGPAAVARPCQRSCTTAHHIQCGAAILQAARAR